MPRALGSTALGAVLADGSELVEDVMSALPDDRYDAVLADMLLQPGPAIADEGAIVRGCPARPEKRTR